jgi:hypothetical protein
MTDITPGGWARNIKPATKYTTVFAGRNTHICHMATVGLPPEEVEANINLIVAAPDLLAALEGVLRVADRQTAEFDAARAAIAKARGE